LQGLLEQQNQLLSEILTELKTSNGGLRSSL
jgi:hypothetical protein